MHLSRKSNPIRQSMFSLHLCEKFSDDLIDLPRILYLLLRPAALQKRIMFHRLSCKLLPRFCICQHDTDCCRADVYSHDLHNLFRLFQHFHRKRFQAFINPISNLFDLL